MARLSDQDAGKFRSFVEQQPSTPSVDKTSLESLLNMGFDTKEATDALILYANNVEDAVEFLTGGSPARPPAPPSKTKKESKCKWTSWP